MDETVRPDEVGRMEERWKKRPRSPEWARRYDVDAQQVQGYLKDRVAERDRQLQRNAEIERERHEQNRRIAFITRASAVAILIALLFSGVMAAMARNTKAQADKKLAGANSALAAANATVKRSQQQSNRLIEQANMRVAMMLMRARRAQAQAHAEQVQAGSAIAAAAIANGKAQTETQLASSQTSRADKTTALTYLAAGRQAFFNGDIDDAAVALAAAYKYDPQNESVRMLLPQALDNLDIRMQPTIAASSDAIAALTFDPQSASQALATADVDGTIKLWNTAGSLIRVLGSRHTLVSAMAFDASGRYLAVGGADGSLAVYDLKANRMRQAARRSAGRIQKLAFQPRGTMLVGAVSDGSVTAWNMQAAPLSLQLSLRDNAGDVLAATDAAFSPDGAVLVAAGSNGALHAWNARTGATLWKQSAAPRAVRLVAVGRGGIAAAELSDGSILVRGPKQTDDAADNRYGVQFNSLAFDGSGTHVAAAGADGTVRILSVGLSDGDAAASQQLVLTAGTLSGVSPAAICAQYAPDGSSIAAGYADGHIAVWSPDGARLATYPGHHSAITALAFAPASARFATTALDGTLAIWTLPSRLVRAGASHQAQIDKIVLSPDGRSFATGSRDGTVGLWQLGDVPQRLHVLYQTTPGAWVSDLHYDASGTQLLSLGAGSGDLWSSSGKLLQRLGKARRGGRTSAGAFLPNDRGVIVAQRNIYGVPASSLTDKWYEYGLNGRYLAAQGGYQEELGQVQVDTGAQYVLGVSPDNGYLTLFWFGKRHPEQVLPGVASASLVPHRAFYLFGSETGILTSRSAASGAILHRTGTAGPRINLIATSADGNIVAWSTSGSNAVEIRRLWASGGFSVDAGAASRLEGASGEIQSISFSPGDGQFVLATSADGIAHVWDRSTGDLVAAIVAPQSVTAAQFTADPARILVGTSSGALYLFRARHLLGSPGQMAAVVLSRVQSTNMERTAAMQHALRDLESPVR